MAADRVPIRTMDHAEVSGKRVLVRVDHNVPLTEQGGIRDDERIIRTAGILRELTARGTRVLILSHLGYPTGRLVPELSTRPLADHVGQLLGATVRHQAGLSLDAVRDESSPRRLLIRACHTSVPNGRPRRIDIRIASNSSVVSDWLTSHTHFRGRSTGQSDSGGTSVCTSGCR